MKDRKQWLYAILALVGGVFGGALSGHLFPPRDAEAAAERVARVRAAHAAGVVKATKFVLVDRDGTERGVIEVNSRGIADIALNDQSGRRRGEFRVGAEGGGAIGFYDRNGDKRVILGETPNGRDGLAIYGTSGRQMAGFTVAEDNQSSVTLYDPASGRARVGLGVAASGVPALVLFDQEGRDRAELHITVNGKPGLALADESGKSVAGLPVQEAQPPQQ
jgi:hypothetical protein